MKAFVGSVSIDERNEIRALNAHKISLEELLPILPIDSELYNEALIDLNSTVEKYNSWWDNTAQKYNWERVHNCSWHIDFETCKVYLNSK